MKANELMIGDWVKVIEPDRYASAKGTILSLTSQEGGYYAIKISDVIYGYLTTDVFNEDIEPIPLTAEILEKNGFQARNRYIWEQKDNYCCIKLNIAPKIEIDGKIFGEPPILLQINGATFSLNIIIEYVHELQHALRLCEIEKEIEL